MNAPTHIVLPNSLDPNSAGLVVTIVEHESYSPRYVYLRPWPGSRCADGAKYPVSHWTWLKSDPNIPLRALTNDERAKYLAEPAK